MTEVRMTLYDASEVEMFAQFVDIMSRSRAAKYPPMKQVDESKPKDVTQAYHAISEQPAAPAAPSVDPVAAAIDKFKTYGQEKGIPAARAVLDGLGLKRAGDLTAAQVPALLEAIK